MKHLIVARYEEDVSWLERVPQDWHKLVVEKGVQLPNEGREASSYFWAMHHVYPRLSADDTLAFVQGDPFPHCNGLIPMLATRDPDEFTPLGHWHVVDDLTGHPHHPGLPIAEYWARWLEGDPPSDVSFFAGAQFMVPGLSILSRPREHYWSMMLDMNLPHAPWVMERLWGYYFE